MKAPTYIEHGKFALTDKPEPEILDPRDSIVRVTVNVETFCGECFFCQPGTMPGSMQKEPGSLEVLPVYAFREKYSSMAVIRLICFTWKGQRSSQWPHWRQASALVPSLV